MIVRFRITITVEARDRDDAIVKAKKYVTRRVIDPVFLTTDIVAVIGVTGVIGSRRDRYVVSVLLSSVD